MRDRSDAAVLASDGGAPIDAGVTRALLLRWAFGVLVVLHLAALYWPRVDVAGPVTGTDKILHVLLFAAPTVAGLLAGVRPAYLLAVVALHAPASELMQHYLLPHRSGDAGDVVADLLGVVLGVTPVLVRRAFRR